MEPTDKVLRSIHKLSVEELSQIKKYVAIFQEQDLHEHHEVNKYITKQALWGDFPAIRAINTHGESTKIPEIDPRFYGAVCKISGIIGGNGAPVTSTEKY